MKVPPLAQLLTILSVSVGLVGCATNIKGVRYVSDSQVQRNLLEVTPLGSNKEQTVAMLRGVLANKKHIYESKDGSEIEVVLAEHPTFLIFPILPSTDRITAKWRFSREGELQDICIFHAIDAL
jgi:hypothetical protein